MKQTSKQGLALVAASALAIAAVTGVFAGGWQGMGHGMGGHQGMMGGPGGMMGMGRGGIGGMGQGMFGSVEQTRERLGQARTELGITGAQQDAWQAYEQAVLGQSALMSAHRETMMGSGSRPTGDQRVAMHQQGSQMMQQTTQARQGLYQVLTPQQRAQADNLIGPGFGAGRRM